MHVVVKIRGAQESICCAELERRVRFALRRIGWRIPVVEMVLGDVNGPRAGADKQCLVRDHFPQQP